MAEHVFVDESKKRDYLLVAAALPETALPGARRALRALLRPGQRRLHMVKESGSRQRQVLGVIRELAPRVTVYRAVRDGRSDTLRRAACLMSLVSHSCEYGAASITLEREDSAEERDRHTIFQQLSRFAPQDRPHYRHVRPTARNPSAATVRKGLGSTFPGYCPEHDQFTASPRARSSTIAPPRPPHYSSDRRLPEARHRNALI